MSTSDLGSDISEFATWEAANRTLEEEEISQEAQRVRECTAMGRDMGDSSNDERSSDGSESEGEGPLAGKGVVRRDFGVREVFLDRITTREKEEEESEEESEEEEEALPKLDNGAAEGRARGRVEVPSSSAPTPSRSQSRELVGCSYSLGFNNY